MIKNIKPFVHNDFIEVSAPDGHYMLIELVKAKNDPRIIRFIEHLQQNGMTVKTLTWEKGYKLLVSLGALNN